MHRQARRYCCTDESRLFAFLEEGMKEREQKSVAFRNKFVRTEQKVSFRFAVQGTSQRPDQSPPGVAVVPLMRQKA